MSLLNRNRAGGHLDDRQFADIFSTAAASGLAAVDPHLSTCAQCRSRYAAFTGWLDKIHDDAVSEADEAFPPERLAMQQAQVMRRIEALERPARVIAFPRFSRPATSTQWHVQRWVAASAAAGLVIGLAAGQFFDMRHMFTPAVSQQQAQAQNARLIQSPVSRPPVLPVSSAVSDETLYFGGDPTRTTERLPILKSIADITPRTRDMEQPR